MRAIAPIVLSLPSPCHLVVVPLQLIDASSLKREVVEGVDIMVVRELTGGERRKGVGVGRGTISSESSCSSRGLLAVRTDA